MAGARVSGMVAASGISWEKGEGGGYNHQCFSGWGEG